VSLSNGVAKSWEPQEGPHWDQFRFPKGPWLLRRLAAGDQRALGELYDGYADFLNAQAMRILRDPTQAEAVVQDVFVRVWHEAAQFDPVRTTPEAWLQAMAHALATERRRAQIVQREGSAWEALGGCSGLWNEDALSVRKAIDSLAPDQRRLMNLVYNEGLSLPEVAARLGEPEADVRARGRMAMARVRQALTRFALARWGVAPMVVGGRLLSRLDGDHSA
jgi:RNA polymerase sigma-70 factor (ECF subfamily)